MTAALSRAVREAIVRTGWEPGSSLENSAARLLSRYGESPETLRQQLRVGPYRLDFADPVTRLAIEIDGWHHRRPESAAKDAERDAWLRSQGWVVLRVDDRHGLESLAAQLSRAVRLLNLERSR